MCNNNNNKNSGLVNRWSKLTELATGPKSVKQTFKHVIIQ